MNKNIIDKLAYKLSNDMRFSLRQLDHRILFMHPPKCGGTSVSRSIKQAYGIYENLYGKNLQKLEGEYSTNAAFAMGRDIFDLRKNVLLYYMFQDNIKYITGHFTYIDDLPADIKERWNYVTILREPVNRWFSHYFFNYTIESGDKNSSSDKLNEQLEKFLDKERERAKEMGQSYVTIFTDNIKYEDRNKNFAAKKAISNLENFKIVGILENLADFAQRFEQLFAAKINVRSLNQNSKRPPALNSIVTNELKSRVQELCAANSQVYSHFSGLIN